MTTDIIGNLDNHSTEGNVSTDNNPGAVKKAVTTVGSAVTSAAGTVAGKAKDVVTSDKVAQAKATVVATVKDPEKREKAVTTAKENRPRIFAIAGAVVALLVLRKVRSARKGRKA